MASADLKLDGLAGARDRFERAYLAAGTGAVRTTTREVEQDVEGIVRGAVPGRLWRAVASQTYPKRGIAREPVGEVYLNGTKRTHGAFDFFTRPGRITSADGFYLAIPLPAAGARTAATRGRPRGPTPGEWERQHGIRLRFVYRSGKPALLVAPAGQLRAVGRRRGTKGLGGADTVPIFVLKRGIDFANTADIDPARRRAPGRLQSNFSAELRKSAGRI